MNQVLLSASGSTAEAGTDQRYLIVRGLVPFPIGKYTSSFYMVRQAVPHPASETACGQAIQRSYFANGSIKGWVLATNEQGSASCTNRLPGFLIGCG